MRTEYCPRCEQPLPPKANFCPNCGAPVAIPEATERRLVTVVFVDMASSTELAARLDAERFREVLAAFHGMVAEEVAWLGGVAEGFIGDAVLAVFGIPASHDDDALRAVRAALEIRDRAAGLAGELGLPMPIQVRIGVHTGQVAVGTAHDRNIVIGAEVNLGARLQQAAVPGEVLAGDPTVQLTASSVDYGEPRAIDAKGFGGPITGRPVRAVRARVVDRRRITFVDRRREVSLLRDVFERAASRRRAHLVTLLGEPGVGKSRVVTEFLAGLPSETRVLIGTSSPFEEDVELWPLAQMVHRRARRRRGGARRPGGGAAAGGGRRLGAARGGRVERAAARSCARDPPRTKRTARSSSRRCARACSRCSPGSRGAVPWCWCSRTSTRPIRCSSI